MRFYFVSLLLFIGSCTKINYQEHTPQAQLLNFEAQAFRHIQVMKTDASVFRTANLVVVEAQEGERKICLEFEPNAKVFGYYHVASYEDEKGNFYSTKLWLSRPETSQKFDSSEIGFITTDGYFEFNAFSASGKQIFINGYLGGNNARD